MRPDALTMTIVPRDLWRAELVFPTSSFPEGTRSLLQGCCERLACVYHAVAIVERECTNDYQKFCRELELRAHDIAGYDGPSPYVMLNYTGTSLQAGMLSLLVSAKSVLDVFGQFVESLARRKYASLKLQFHSKGEKLLRFLRRCELSQLPERDGLISLIQEHKALWVDRLIDHRDHMVHHGVLLSFEPMYLMVATPIGPIDLSQTVHPSIRGEGDLVAYAKSVERNLDLLLTGALALLPRLEEI